MKQAFARGWQHKQSAGLKKRLVLNGIWNDYSMKEERRRLNANVKNSNERQSGKKEKAAQIRDVLKLTYRDDTVLLEILSDAIEILEKLFSATTTTVLQICLPAPSTGVRRTKSVPAPTRAGRVEPTIRSSALEQ